MKSSIMDAVVVSLAYWSILGQEYYHAIFGYFAEQFVIWRMIEYSDGKSKMAAWDLSEYKAEIVLMPVDRVLTINVGVTKKK